MKESNRKIKLLLIVMYFVIVASLYLLLAIDILNPPIKASSPTAYVKESQSTIFDEVKVRQVKAAAHEPDLVVEETPESEEIYISEDEINLIALVTMAEAEGESEEGKRLVIDTILNRVDSEHFPDTISEVIYQPNQFTSMWNGRVDRCYVMDDICQLVREELVSRTNSEVVFFTAGKYGAYGKPMFQVGNHYFASYG